MYYEKFEDFLLAANGKVETLELKDYEEIKPEIAKEDKPEEVKEEPVAKEAEKPKRKSTKKKNDSVQAD